jgi:hypothetical protein
MIVLHMGKKKRSGQTLSVRGATEQCCLENRGAASSTYVRKRETFTTA